MSILKNLRRALGRGSAVPEVSSVASIDARLQEVVAAAPVGIARVTLNGRWISFNDACASILGYTRSELTRLTLHDLTERDDARREVALMREMLEGRANSYRITKRIADKNGGTRVIHLTAIVVRGADAESDAFLYVIEAADWRAEIDPLNHRVAAAVIDQLSCTAIIWLDPDGLITGWNPGAERLFGLRRGEAIGKHRRELYRDADHEMADQELAIAQSRGRFSDIGWRRKGDGTDFRVQTSIVRLTPDGTTRGFVEEVMPDLESIHRQKAEATLNEHRLQIRKKVTDIELRAAEGQRELAVLANALREEVQRRKVAEAELELLRNAHAELLFAPRPTFVELELEIEEPSTLVKPTVEPVRHGAASASENVKDWRDADGRGATDLILETTAKNRSGVLVLESHNHRAEVFFEHGRIAATASDDPSSLLGEWMVRRGLITDAARQQALEMSDFGEIAFGRSLLTLKVLTEDQIISAVREKIESDVEHCAARTVVRWAFVHAATTRTLVPIGVDARELRAMQTFVALPSGKRYHLPSCVSLQHAASPVLLTASAALQRGLAPCRRCLAVTVTETAPAVLAAS
jgi:PAS domain S-box-containing protein